MADTGSNLNGQVRGVQLDDVVQVLEGQDDAGSLYWGLVGEAVWNNGGDSAFLRDSEGNLVDDYTY